MSVAIEPRHGAPAALQAIAAEHARSRRRRRLRGLGKHAFLIVITFLLVAPFYYVVLASFKNSTEIFTYPPKLLPIPPFKLLYYTAILNGIISPPLLFIVVRIAGSRKIMGEYANSVWMNAIGWALCDFMTVALVALLWSLHPG